MECMLLCVFEGYRVDPRKFSKNLVLFLFYNGEPHIYRVGGREGKLNAIIIFYVYRNNGIVLLCLELFQGRQGYFSNLTRYLNLKD